MPTREELKALRLRAMGVVGAEMQKTADMYGRVIAAGAQVATARDTAETAHMEDLKTQVADLKEMADELTTFGQVAAPTTGGQSGGKPSAGSSPPAGATVKPSTGTEALKALMAAQPNPPAGEKITITAGEVGKIDPSAFHDGDAYHGTNPPIK